VPFAAKNLFDIEGIATLAGSRVLGNAPAAACDAALVTRLTGQGAIMIGALFTLLRNREPFGHLAPALVFSTLIAGMAVARFL